MEQTFSQAVVFPHTASLHAILKEPTVYFGIQTFSISTMLQSGQELQVVKYSKDVNNFILDEAALSQILLREDVKDLPVVLVSVAGAFRGGKSFLLNFFLRYLTAPEQDRNESGAWLGAENTPLTGFGWRGGSSRHTTGMLLWSEPIFATLPSGDKVAVLLMDTQGTFDSSSTVRDCSTIFALSTLVSSVQIYNLKENIREDDLQHLQLFTEYGKQMRKEDGSKPFQVLEFLVRDWPFSYENDYGQVGGDEFLAERLKVTDDMPAELRELRQNIRACFDTVTCFLMPHPGNNVLKQAFAGELNNLDEVFKTALKQLIPSILAPANLTPKVINGQRVAARDLFTFFKTYVAVFNSDTLPPVHSIMKATADAALLAAAQEARELYERRMRRLTDGPSLPPQALEREHKQALAAARTAFEDKKKMSSQKDSYACLAKMTQDLEDLLPAFRVINRGKVEKAVMEAKEAYEASIRRVHGSDMLCLHPADMNTIHNNAVAAALSVYDAKRKQFPDITDDERTSLLEELLKRLDDLIQLNNEHNRIIVADVKLTFMKDVTQLLTRDPPLDSYDFRVEYYNAKYRALVAFNRRRNMASTYYGDVYKDDLERSIENQYYVLRDINRSTH